jgi:hypothetical protein
MMLLHSSLKKFFNSQLRNFVFQMHFELEKVSQIINTKQSWNRLENGEAVQSGRLKNSTGPVQPVGITCPTGEIG